MSRKKSNRPVIVLSLFAIACAGIAILFTHRNQTSTEQDIEEVIRLTDSLRQEIDALKEGYRYLYYKAGESDTMLGASIHIVDSMQLQREEDYHNFARRIDNVKHQIGLLEAELSENYERNDSTVNLIRRFIHESREVLRTLRPPPFLPGASAPAML